MKIALRSALFLLVSGSVVVLPATADSPAATPPPATTAAPAAAPAASPKLVAVEAVRDVGKVNKGENVEVVFELRNTGTTPLTITDVRPTCGCTVARYDATIAPGGTGKVHAAVDTSDFAGPIAKTVTVLSNDAANPRLTLTIKATVEQLVHLQPGFARFNFVQTQAPTTVKQWVWADDLADFRVTGVESPYKFVTSTFRPAKADEGRPENTSGLPQWIVETTIQPDAEVGALRDFLVIQTNHPKQKELKVPISGFVRPILSVTPFEADFGVLEM
jgi:hypothetical protein